MIIILILMFILLINTPALSQEKIIAKELTKKEIRSLRRKKAFEKQKIEYKNRGLNAWGVNENAPNLVMAIREHLGSARIDPQRGLVIIRQSESFSNAQKYPLWVIDGQQFNSPPNDVLALSPLIRKVRVLVSAAEVNRWGKQARAGVIVL